MSLIFKSAAVAFSEVLELINLRDEILYRCIPSQTDTRHQQDGSPKLIEEPQQPELRVNRGWQGLGHVDCIILRPKDEVKSYQRYYVSGKRRRECAQDSVELEGNRIRNVHPKHKPREETLTAP